MPALMHQSSYVGTLHEINPEASTIALENVISYGTEGRRGNPAEEIAPSASVYEYIVFRGSDVKDISVAEEKENTLPEPPQVPNDPAILGVSRSYLKVGLLRYLMKYYGCFTDLF
jgi:protein LSM14